MTDREVQMAIYKALEQIYAALTGKPLIVTVETTTGTITIQGATSAALCSGGNSPQAA